MNEMSTPARSSNSTNDPNSQIRVNDEHKTSEARDTLESFFSGQFENKERLPLDVVKRTPSAPNEIQAISGATITSSAVTAGVNAAADYWKRNIKESLK